MEWIDYDGVAEIYDLYVTADYDLSFFLQEAVGVGGPVLELASGTGRLSIPLIQAGVRLTCVDVSRGMLARLSRKLEERDLEAEIHQADVCELRFDARFQLAIFPFQSFMEIVGEARQRRALSAIFGCLGPGGRFVCTLHNPTVRRAQVDGSLRVVGRFPTPDGSLVVSGFEQGGDPVVRRLQFFEFYRDDGVLTSKRMLSMEFELIGHSRFEAMAREAGFHVVELLGGYDRSPFDEVRSPLMLWVLERPIDAFRGERPESPSP